MKTFKRNEVLLKNMVEEIGFKSEDLEKQVVLLDVVPCRLITGRTLFDIGKITFEQAVILAKASLEMGKEQASDELNFPIYDGLMQKLAEMDVLYDETTRNGSQIPNAKLFFDISGYNRRLFTPIGFEPPTTEYRIALKKNLRYFFSDTNRVSGILLEHDEHYHERLIGKEVRALTPQNSVNVNSGAVDYVREKLEEGNVSDEVRALGGDNSSALVQAILLAHKSRGEMFARNGVIKRIFLGYSENSMPGEEKVQGSSQTKDNYLFCLKSFLENPDFE